MLCIAGFLINELLVSWLLLPEEVAEYERVISLNMLFSF
jgi:hypothetical protein